jgi:general secretion pathway protein I
VTRATPNTDAGFTLLEVLVALAVLATGAVSLLVATQTHAARISQIEARTVARWVADNRLAALRLNVTSPPMIEMLGQRWRVDVQRSPTDDTDLERVDIAVGTATEGTTQFELSGFIDTGARRVEVAQ